MAETLPTTHGQARVEFRWSANTAPNFRQAIVEDVTDDSEEATCKRCMGSTTGAEHDTTQRKRRATEDRDEGPNKRARLADMTANLTEGDISAVPLGGATGSS